MNFSIPMKYATDLDRFQQFLDHYVVPHVETWNHDEAIPREFFDAVGRGNWFGFRFRNGGLTRGSALRASLLLERLAAVSSGVAVAVLAHADLGMMGLWLFGSKTHHASYGQPASTGRTLLCLGNTETGAGSDVANIATTAKKVRGGWLLNGTKAYVTNGTLSDMALVTAVSDPKERRSNRISMFLVDLSAPGVTRIKLNKQVWLPSDLTRITLKNVFVRDDDLLGERGKGIQQVLTVFTHSRVTISGMTLGTAVEAFEKALHHATKRKVFGQRIVDHQAKAFEIADFYARIEAARLTVQKACWAMDQKRDFRLEASLAKYLTVCVARDVTRWAADIFGASSVIREHPIHKFPMDAWASSLGEGTQDVQRLVIFREVMKYYEEAL